MSCQIFNISTGGDSTASVGNLFQYLTTLTEKKGWCSNIILCGLPYIVSCPVNEQCLFFSPSHQVLTDTDELSCPVSSPLRLQSHSSLSLFSLEKCISALILSALCWTHSSRSLPLMVWETKSEHCTPGGTSSVQSREELVIHQDSQVFLWKAALLLVRPQPIPGTWGFSSPAAGLGFSPH